MMYGDRTPVDQARIDAATQVRRLAHEVVRADMSEADLRALAGVISAQADRLGSVQNRVRDRFRFESADELSVPADGAEFANSVDRPVSGEGNPWSVPLRVFRRGDRVVSTVTLGPGFEGAPGRSHGGLVAAIYDDLLGFVQSLHRRIAFTATLTIDYVAPTPIGEPLDFSAWLDRSEGKKLFVLGDCRSGDDVLSRCSALFIDAAEFFATD